MSNVYFEKLKLVVGESLGMFGDGKIEMTEIWSFLLTVGQAVQAILLEVKEFDETDLAQLQEAAVLLYSEYVEPIDMPGPDYIVDPLILAILPGLIHGAYLLAKKQEKEFLDLPVEGE